MLRYCRRRLGGMPIFKLIALTAFLFALLHLSLPAPPQRAHELVATHKETVRVIEEKSLRKNRRPGKFYENIIVHFDLKGAPPRVSYFLDLLTLTAQGGATGVLLEWEDMFPYDGRLAAARSSDAYTMDDVKRILSHAKRLGLDIIPLVQTFGHLEWILKLEEFRKYRDMDEYAQVICLGDAEAISLVKDAISQVMAAHAFVGIPYFHIGCDEAFSFGNCKAATKWITANGASREELALTHMKELAMFVMQKSDDTVVLVWNDMLRSFPTLTIQKLELGKFVEPVVWDYSENIVTLNEMTWTALSANFPTVWASSAFKGANFPSVQYIDIRHYEANNRAWIDQKKYFQARFKEPWRGIIITGWQRYDHMVQLCEILPMGTPSMVLQVQIAKHAEEVSDKVTLYRNAQKILNCTDYRVNSLNIVSNRCGFPGFEVYVAFQQNARNSVEYVERELKENHQILGWMAPYSRKHRMAQNWYLQQIEPLLMSHRTVLSQSITTLRKAMTPLFFDNTIEEFIAISIGETLDKINSMLTDLREMKAVRVWPKRHFDIKTSKT